MQFTGPYVHMAAITKELKIEGFIVTRFTTKYPTAFADMKQWISEVDLQFLNINYFVCFSKNQSKCEMN